MNDQSDNVNLRPQGYVKDYKKSRVLRRLVNEGYEWSTPGYDPLQGKKHKCLKKLNTLAQIIGEYGPILDLIIRSTIPEMIIMNYSEKPANITLFDVDEDDRYVMKQGALIQSLLKKIKEKNVAEQSTETNQFIEYIKKWFKSKANKDDYNTAYREKRLELLNSQLSNLLYCPQFIVSITFFGTA